MRKLDVTRGRDCWAYEESTNTGGEYSVIHEGVFADPEVRSDEIEEMVKNYYVRDLGYSIVKKKKKKNKHTYYLGERK